MWKKWNISRHVQTIGAIWVFNYGKNSYVRQLKLFIYILRDSREGVILQLGGWDRRWQLIMVKERNAENLNSTSALGGSFGRPKEWQVYGVCWADKMVMDRIHLA
jgi:hypothetical protein